MTRILISFFIALMLSCTALPSFGGGDEVANKEYANYKAATEIMAETFGRVLSKEGTRWRTAILLGKCGKAGLAKAVAQSDSEINKEIESAIFHILYEDKSAIADFNSKDTLIVHAAVSTAIGAYRLGFERGAQMIVADRTTKAAACSTAFSAADELLKKPEDKAEAK